MNGIRRKLCAWRTAQHRGEAGQALVETAISVPLLFLMLLGAAEFARLAYAAIEVANAARAGADYGASSHAAAADWSQSGSTFSAGVVTAATADAANLVGASALTVTNISLSCSCAASKTVTSPTQPTSCTDNTTCESEGVGEVETITVDTQAAYDPLIHFPGGPLSLTLKGQSIQTVSNQ